MTQSSQEEVCHGMSPYSLAYYYEGLQPLLLWFKDGFYARQPQYRAILLVARL